MAAIAPPVAATRVAVRRALRSVRGPVLVACSGGADSMALAAATAFVAKGRAGLVSVDHGLQPGSAERARGVASWGAVQGLAPSIAVSADVAGRPGGPEAAARDARYAALVRAARDHGAHAVLLGHTRDDQAETVLLALARGAGPRGLSAMPAEREIDGVTFLRPLLGVARDDARKACAALGLQVWDDPHNTDAAYARSRVRATALPALVEALGPKVVANLARTAGLAARDAGALDRLAEAALADARTPGGLAIQALAAMDPAIRTRVLHAFALELGCPPAAVSHRHVEALDALVVDWHGQGPVHLPGGIEVARRGGTLGG